MSANSLTLKAGWVGIGNPVSIIGSAVGKKLVLAKMQFVNTGIPDVALNVRLYKADTAASIPIVPIDMPLGRGSLDTIESGETLTLMPGDYISAYCDAENTVSVLITGDVYAI